MPSEAETRDAEALKVWIHDRKLQTFEYLRSFINADAAFIRATGHQSREDAFVKTLARATGEIEKRILAHERKYPDNRKGDEE